MKRYLCIKNYSLLFLIATSASCSYKNNNENTEVKNITNNYSTESCYNMNIDEPDLSVKESLKKTLSFEDYFDLEEKMDWYTIKKNDDQNVSNELLFKLEEVIRKYENEIQKLGEEKYLEILKFQEKVKNNIAEITKNNKIFELADTPKFSNITSHNYSFEKYYSIYEATYFANKFSNVVNDLIQSNKLNQEYFPILENVNENSKSIKFMHKSTFETRNISINNSQQIQDILKFKKYLNDNFKKIKPYTRLEKDGEIILNNVQGTQGLTAAMVIQTIFDMYERNSISNNYSLNSNLNSYLKAHAYLNIAMLSQQVYDEITQTTQIVSALSAHTQHSSKLIQSIGNISAKANIALNIASIGLSIAELSYATNQAETIQFGTQLGFDTLGLFTGISNIILYKTGALTASSVIGALNVPLAGLAIGFSGFATAAAQAQTETVEVAEKFSKHIEDFHKVGQNNQYLKISQKGKEIFYYNNLPYKTLEIKEDHDGNSQISVTNHDVVIRELDLTEKGKVKITFGSHLLYETNRWEKYGGVIVKTPILSVFGDDPSSNKDKSKVISVNNSLELESNRELQYIDDAPFILPMVPLSYISYGYHYTPGILINHDSNFHSLRKIQEKNFKFMFEFFRPYPVEYVIRNMNFDFQETQISIKLGDEPLSLFTPNIPDAWSNKIEYNFMSGSGNYYLKLSDRAKYSITSNGNDKWLIDTQDIQSKITLSNNSVRINKTEIKFEGDKKPLELVFIQSDGLYKIVNLNNLSSKISIANYANEKNKGNFNDYLDQNIDHEFQNDGFIEIENYGDILNKKAWYDVKLKKIISPTAIKSKNCKRENSCKLNQNLVIVGKNNQYFFFYNPIYKELYYMKYNENYLILNTELEYIDDHVNGFTFDNEVLFYKTLDNIGISVIDPQNPKIISIKSSSNDIENLKEISKSNGFELSNEVIFFDDHDHFTGWYLKDKDVFMSKDLINEPSILEKISDKVKSFFG